MVPISGEIPSNFEIIGGHRHSDETMLGFAVSTVAAGGFASLGHNNGQLRVLYLYGIGI